MQKNKWGRLITITLVGGQAARGWPAAFEFDSRRRRRFGAHRWPMNTAADGITVNKTSVPGYTRHRLATDDLASTISARSGSKPEDVICRLEREVPRRPTWHAAGICRQLSRSSLPNVPAT